MTDEQLLQFARAMLDAARPHLERSEPLRKAAGLFAQWVMGEIARIEAGDSAAAGGHDEIRRPLESASSASTSIAAPSSSSATIVSPAPSGGLPMSSALVPLRIGDTVTYVPATGTTAELGRARQAAQRAEGEASLLSIPSEGRELDMGLVVKRCRLKAASCRLGIQKRAAANESAMWYTTPGGVQIQSQMHAMLDEAKATDNCFLWAFWPEREPPSDEVFTACADCYDAMADAAALVARLEGAGVNVARPDVEVAFQFLASACSALRGVLRETWLTRDDIDQFAVHLWLRYHTQTRQIYVEHHMRLDDPASAAEMPGLRAGIRETLARLDNSDAHAKRIKAMFDKVRYHARLALSATADEREGHWSKIKAAVESAMTLGVRPGDARFGQALGTAIELCPPELAELIRLSKPTHVEDEEEMQPRREWSGDVLRVRQALRGRQIVVIGGERRRPAIERLIEAFELADVEWVELVEHSTGSAMMAPIRRPQTALVVVIIKLTGHLHAEEARQFAVEADKACVYLTGGYNPERVAHEAIEQVSEQLEGMMRSGAAAGHK